MFPQADRKVTGDEWSRCANTGMAVKAVRGDAVLFFSLDLDGKEDPTSLHGSCPTTKGEKWSATKWIHVGSTLRCASGCTAAPQPWMGNRAAFLGQTPWN